MLKDPSHLDFMCFYRFSTVLHSFDIRHWRCAGCHYLITFATIHHKKSLFHESGNVIFWRIMPISETIYIDSHLPRAFSLLWYGFSLSTASKQFSPTKNHGGIARDVTMAKLCTWCHSGHVSGQEQKHFSPLGTKLCKFFGWFAGDVTVAMLVVKISGNTQIHGRKRTLRWRISG